MGILIGKLFTNLPSLEQINVADPENMARLYHNDKATFITYARMWPTVIGDNPVYYERFKQLTGQDHTLFLK